MSNIVQFPTNHDPKPTPPTAATRAFLAQGKCTAVCSFRIPPDLKRYLVCEAYEADARFSEHLARIVADHVGEQGLQGLLMDREQKAA